MEGMGTCEAARPHVCIRRLLLIILARQRHIGLVELHHVHHRVRSCAHELRNLRGEIDELGLREWGLLPVLPVGIRRVRLPSLPPTPSATCQLLVYVHVYMYAYVYVYVYVYVYEATCQLRGRHLARQWAHGAHGWSAWRAHGAQGW